MSWVAVAVAGGTAVAGIANQQLADDETKAPPATDPVDMSVRGINLRRDDAFPRILQGHREFDEQFQQSGLRNLRSSFTRDDGLRDIIESDLIPSIRRQRQELSVSDMDLLRRLSPNFAQSESLTGDLQRMTQADLALGGQLSDQDIRALEQQVGSATQSRGRGSGAFAVGQLALSRDSARRARQSSRYNAASNAAQLGLQMSQPGQSILNRNAQQVGSPLDLLRSNMGIAETYRPQFPVIDQDLLQLESLKLGQGLAGAQMAAQRGVEKRATNEAAISGMGQAFGAAFSS